MEEAQPLQSDYHSKQFQATKNWNPQESLTLVDAKYAGNDTNGPEYAYFYCWTICT